MATHLDLDEQEQIDQLKAFWKQYGNLITWLVILVLLGYAGWQGWNWWQRDQAAKAAAMFDSLEAAAGAGDAEKSARVFADLKERYARTAFTQQAALLAAKVQHDKGQLEAARDSLAWAAENATENEYRTVARLRLAGLLLDEKKYDEALKQLDGAGAVEFAALVADRRGDILLAQGKRAEAKDAYTVAWKTFDESVQYRTLVEAKLAALGAAPDSAAAASGAAK
jgi:predicted negative regulator of RcsB-dependent stress response